MRYSTEELEYIAARTDYDCHLCHDPVSFEHYGNCSHQAGWEVDHVRPKSKGGHNGFSNLRAAHAYCNRMKGNKTNRSVRRKFGVKGVPPSFTAKVINVLKISAVAAGVLGLAWWILKPPISPAKQ